MDIDAIDLWYQVAGTFLGLFAAVPVALTCVFSVGQIWWLVLRMLFGRGDKIENDANLLAGSERKLRNTQSKSENHEGI